MVETADQTLRESIAKLLRFESSALPAGKTTNFDEYALRMRAGERNIYFLSAPNRELAEASPYFEAIKKRADDTEVGLSISMHVLKIIIFSVYSILYPAQSKQR